MSLAAFGVRRPVVANLVMFAIIGAGLVFGLGLRREFFPEIRSNMVSIFAPYPGATPDEVERALASKIEDALLDLRDVDEINTTVGSGVASVMIEFEPGVDIDAAVADVKREIDALQDLPDEADRIVVDKFEPNIPAIVLALYGDADEAALKRAVREIQDDLRSLPGMGQVAIDGVRTDEILVQARPEALLKHQLSLADLAREIRLAMIELPGGSVKSQTRNIAIRAPGVEERADAIREIVVKSAPGGQRVRLADVADVAQSFADTDLRTRLNGAPAVSLTVFKVGEQDAVHIAEMVKAYVAGRTGHALTPTLGERLASFARPPGDTTPVSTRARAHELGAQRLAAGELPGTLVTTTDLARFIVGRLDLLTRNAVMGMVLVFGILMLALSWRVSFWVTAGMIISLLGTLAMMRFVGITLNLLTMFGLIIVVGILVDDAIVVAENIKTRHERGEDATRAAIVGTNEVGWPVVATVLTTIFAFLPLGLIEGQVGDFLAMLPLVVTCALTVSLLESLFILPTHIKHTLDAEDRAMSRRSWLTRIERAIHNGREAFFDRGLVPFYTRVIRACIRWRYATLGVAIAAALVSIGMVAGGRLAFVFIASADAETINGELRMPVGTATEVTDRALRTLEAAALEFPEIKSVWVQVGAVASLDGGSSSEAPHLAQMILELTPVEERTAKGQRRSDQVIIALREAVGEIPGVRRLRFEEIGGGPSGAPINLGIVGATERQIRAASADLRTLLDEFPDVYDVADDAELGQREVRLTLREGASELGFTVAGLAEQVRGAVFGLEAFTFAGVREDVDVRVTLPESTRRSLAAIEAMHVFTPDGRPVPLTEVAHLVEDDSYATIRRLNGQRIVTVSADVNTDRQSPEAIVRNIQPRLREIEADHGVLVVPRGRQKEQGESFATLPRGMLAAIGLIYVVLTWLFQSYTQPLIVLTAVPFAIVGMVWGHIALGFDMTMLSLIGFVALSGIVVNDSLIFMEFFNHRRREGLSVARACVDAGRARIRAILLTTLTTVLGLTPLILEQSFQARFLIPMAITISGGLISATVLILLVLPCMLVVFDDATWALRALWRGRTDPRQSVTLELDQHRP